MDGIQERLFPSGGVAQPSHLPPPHLTRRGVVRGAEAGAQRPQAVPLCNDTKEEEKLKVFALPESSLFFSLSSHDYN